MAASQGVHKKVLVCTDANGAATYDIEIDFSSAQTSGSVDIWFQTSDNTAVGYLQLLAGDDTVAIQVDLNAIAGVGDDTWYHYSIQFDCTPDTYEHWLDGSSIASGVAFTNAVTSILTIKFISTNAAQLINYYDAIGFSWDSDYVFGDDCFWKGLKDIHFEDDELESEPSGWTIVEAANTEIKIVPFFDEHKKVLQIYDNNGAGTCNATSPTWTAVADNGIEFWFRIDDITTSHGFIFQIFEDATILIQIAINQDDLRYFNGAWVDVKLAAIAVDTWYHLRIEPDDSANTFNLYLDGIKELTGGTYWNNSATGSTSIKFGTGTDDTFTGHIDALGEASNTSYRIADNRTHTYHLESYDDITSNIERCFVTDRGYDGSTAIITDDTTITISELHLVQLLDENSDLRFEGNVRRADNPNVQNQYPLVSSNNDELLDENSYTASSAEDVNASLLAIHTNVSQVDGRLIYYTLDDPSGNLTPNFRNKPKNMGIRWFAIHGGKVASIEPNGRFTLDDDRNPENGAETISSTTGEILGPPRISVVKHQINYVEVRGAIDPDTGTPFSGISQDTDAQADGTGIKRYFKRFRELQSDTDCSNRATQIRTGSGFEPTVIAVELKSVYAIPGEIINFAYSPLSFSATNMFIEAPVVFNLVQGKALYRLNTGIFDIVAMNTPGYTYADETADDINETLYNTDLITTFPDKFPGGGAVESGLVVILDAVNEICYVQFYVDSNIDENRDITITYIFKRGDAGGDTITMSITWNSVLCDNSGTTDSGGGADTLPATTLNRFDKKIITIAAADVTADTKYEVVLKMNEAAKDVSIYLISVKYHQKRVIT